MGDDLLTAGLGRAGERADGHDHEHGKAAEGPHSHRMSHYVTFLERGVKRPG